MFYTNFLNLPSHSIVKFTKHNYLTRSKVGQRTKNWQSLPKTSFEKQIQWIRVIVARHNLRITSTVSCFNLSFQSKNSLQEEFYSLCICIQYVLAHKFRNVHWFPHWRHRKPAVKVVAVSSVDLQQIDLCNFQNTKHLRHRFGFHLQNNKFTFPETTEEKLLERNINKGCEKKNSICINWWPQEREKNIPSINQLDLTVGWIEKKNNVHSISCFQWFYFFFFLFLFIFCHCQLTWST